MQGTAKYSKRANSKCSYCWNRHVWVGFLKKYKETWFDEKEVYPHSTEAARKIFNKNVNFDMIDHSS
jgi:hypothetical protein